jgi:outer membrane receptor protein involved in Fe transport
VWDVTDDLSMTVDYYKIELNGSIQDLSSTFTLDAEAGCRTGLTRNREPFAFAPDSAYCQSVLTRIDRISNPGASNDGQISEIRSGPINRSFLSTKGIDASLNYRFDGDDWGVFNTSLAWSHTLEQKTQEFPNDPINSYRDDLTNFDFRSRVRGSVSWVLNDWNAAVFGLRSGSLPNWGETGRIAPYITWNLNVGKAITENARVSLYVNNVFDNVHPRDDSFNSYPYFWRAYSPIGREVSVQWDYSF